MHKRNYEMIKVSIFRENDQITAFEISGHAGSGPYGYDLVCAGVSAVSFGAVNAVLTMCDPNLHIEQADEGGYLFVSLPTSMENEHNAQILFEGMLVSLKTIEREYSQFIQIEEVGGAPK